MSDYKWLVLWTADEQRFKDVFDTKEEAIAQVASLRYIKFISDIRLLKCNLEKSW